jgi:hypothetical protein
MVFSHSFLATTLLGTTVLNLDIIKELIFDDTAFDLHRMIYTWSDSRCISKW